MCYFCGVMAPESAALMQVAHRELLTRIADISVCGVRL